MFKSLTYFSERNLSWMKQCFRYVPKEVVNDDFNSISEKELLNFCEKNKENLENSLHNVSEDNLIEELKKEFILDYIRKQIPKMRLQFLKDSNKPYCYDELRNLSVNKDGLITLDDYFSFPRKNPYMLCLPISDINSYYWIWKEILDLKDNNDISIKIRLDPIVKNPLQAIYKMAVFSDSLNWKTLCEITDKTYARFIDDYHGNKTELYWQRIGDELHFKCEELPLYEEIENRGSRYFHAIYDIRNEIISHCDGSIKIYGENDFLLRNDISLWDENSKNYGKYIKIFRADGKINPDKFTALIASFFVHNMDVNDYFENLSK